MPQTIQFATIPNTQTIAYSQTLALLLGEVKRSRPDQKTFREFLRMRNLFDKEALPVLLDFLDLRGGERSGEAMVLGPFAQKLFDADNDDTTKALLAKRLVDLNPLLAKYCIEAMDTEHGGRLHSTNELYRMITSYVYPGEKPTLGAFKAWVDWAVASGILRLVGIRWALAEKGIEHLPKLRSIDAEEYLEEERESAESAASGADEEAAAEAEPATEEAEPAQAPSAMDADASDPGVASDSPVEPSERPPLPTAAVPPPPPEPRAPSAAATPSAGRSRSVRAPGLSPVDRMVVPGAPVRPEDLAVVRDSLLGWYEQFPGRRPLTVATVGFDANRRTPTLMFELSFAALLLSKGLPNDTVRQAMDTFRQSGLLLVMAKGKTALEGLANVMTQNADPAFLAACEATVHLPRLLAGTADQAALLRSEDPRELLWTLFRKLYEPMFPMAPFVLARFLLDTKYLAESVVPAAFVPTFTVRENAFRIGFLERMYASSFADLVDEASALAAWFPTPWFEGPIAQVHEGFGCAFRCGRAAVCPLSCREKCEVGR